MRIWGIAFDNTYQSRFNEAGRSRVIVPEIVTLPNVGDVLTAWVVPEPEVPIGAGDVYIQLGSFTSNRLPWVVEEVQ